MTMQDHGATIDAAPLARREALRSGERLRWLERALEIRAVEDRVQQLFHDGHVDGTTHTCQGQEAVSVGLAAAARPTDTVACTYRGHGHALALGLSPRAVVGEIAGRTCGTMGGLGGSMHLSAPDVGLLPTFAIVGAGIPVAAGAAFAAQVRGTDDVGIAVFGDGAVNIGAFHEGLNLASVWKLPCVFVIENNLYAEYSPVHVTTPIEDLARRAEAYAMPGAIVDGQDVEAVHAAMLVALERARAGEGPTLLEMKTYRYAGHSRSDQAPYRAPGELERWKQRDPIDLLAAQLERAGELEAGGRVALEAAIRADVERIVAEVLATPKPEPHDMLRGVYA